MKPRLITEKEANILKTFGYTTVKYWEWLVDQSMLGKTLTTILDDYIQVVPEVFPVSEGDTEVAALKQRRNVIQKWLLTLDTYEKILEHFPQLYNIDIAEVWDERTGRYVGKQSCQDLSVNYTNELKDIDMLFSYHLELHKNIVELHLVIGNVTMGVVPILEFVDLKDFQWVHNHSYEDEIIGWAEVKYNNDALLTQIKIAIEDLGIKEVNALKKGDINDITRKILINYQSHQLEYYYIRNSATEIVACLNDIGNKVYDKNFGNSKKVIIAKYS